MHFGKTYTQLLLSLPPELSQNAIQYRQLKKLIRQVVDELASHGLSPDVLHELFTQSAPAPKGKGKAREDVADEAGASVQEIAEFLKKEDAEGRTVVSVKYELGPTGDGQVQPRLRVKIAQGDDAQREHSESETTYEPTAPSGAGPSGKTVPPATRELLIPLAADSAFFSMLAAALEQLSTHLATLRAQFEQTLHRLSRAVAAAARPMSEAAAASFVPHSLGADPAGSMHIHPPAARSDLYTWREVFQIYLEAEVFESGAEASRGERSVEDAEERLQAFVQKLRERDLWHDEWAGEERRHRRQRGRLQLKESIDALVMFLRMNETLLDLKKFQYANLEALRKILKKHSKRTALPIPKEASPISTTFPPIMTSDHGLSASESDSADDLALVPSTGNASASVISLLSPALQPGTPYSIISLFPTHASSLSHTLVQAIGQELIPMVPQLDDYACLICTSIAFKPIRLRCGHLFCVRCLVKMQKRGQGDCPMCRAHTVLDADRSNVDWALLNFMKDWFPVEAKQKLKQNEREAAQEELRELGFNPDAQGCVIA